MENPIFILGAHKSGTSLLRALFDGHDELFVIPIEAHFFQILNRWIDYPLRKKLPQPIDRKKFIKNACVWIDFSNASEDQQADNVTKGYFNASKFEQYLEMNLPADSYPVKSPRLYIEAYIKAIHFSLYDLDLNDGKRIVEKSVDNAEFAVDLQQIFPSASFIHIVRNPYANLVSLRKYKTSGRYPRLDYILGSLKNSYYHLHRNRLLLNNYKVIRYEDLVTNPQKIITGITDHLGLPLQDSMYKPTSMGDLWKGNSTSAKKFEGISADRLGKWEKEINALEIELINEHFLHIVEEFGYERHTSSKTALLPNKKEPLKYYTVNRLLRYGRLM